MSSDRPDLVAELDDVTARLSDPDLPRDPKAYAVVARRHKELSEIVGVMAEISEARGDAEAAREMMGDVGAEDREMLRGEIDNAERIEAELSARLDELLIPRDPNDDKNVIVEIRGAEGGEEANLFARDLYEMYQAYASARKWGTELLEARPSDMGGYSEITFMVKGDGVWSRLKHEGGPHRVQRVPVTESQGRIHTSSATVTVLPEADEVDVSVDEADLEVDVYRSSGPGGQSVNTTDSAVRITHKPTGIVVSMQDEKSQLQNRQKAMRVLRARLLQAEEERRAAELSDQRRGQIGGGGRSEKIRTYNYKENRVTDHRIGLTLYKLDKILAGDLGDVVDELARHEREAQLAESGGD
ncbi:MAG: peptide chain release factor 1 [Acidimicrobiales bacterium]